MLMKKLQFSVVTKTCLLAIAGMLAVSCAQDGFDDEAFSSDVKNADHLDSPTADDITITPNADGSRQTIAWPLVKGAGGFEVKVNNLNDPDNIVVVVDSIVDGYSVTIAREEDTNYEVSIRTLGNTKLNNPDAATATVKAFSTFTASFAVIPAGTDLYEYFQSNPVPDPAEDAESDEFIYDLEADGVYTLTQSLDFNYHKVTIRTTSKTNHAVINMGETANFIASNDLTLNYVTINMPATNKKPLIELLNYETAPDGILEKPGNYYLINYLRIMNSEINGLTGSLVFDNNKSWCVVTLMLKNVLMPLATVTENIRNEAFISFQGGGVKDFSMSNSTVYQTGEGNPKYFLRYNNSARVDRFGWTTSDRTTMTYANNTFYKVASGNWANYSGMQNYTTYDIQNNIWYACGDGAIARRIMGGGRLGSGASAVWNNNTYWNAEGQIDQGTYDTGTVLATDPAFADPANGDFTPTGAEQVEKKTGDPRWFTTTE